MNKNLRMPCDAVPGTRYAETRYSQISRGVRPTVADSNYLFLKRGVKIREPTPHLVVVATIGLVKVSSCLGNKDCRRRHGFAQGNRARAVLVSHPNLLRLGSWKPGPPQRNHPVVCMFTGSHYGWLPHDRVARAGMSSRSCGRHC